MSRTLLIRADADERIGTGHVMRCLALAQAWQAAGGRACFAAASLGDAIAARLHAEGLELWPVEAPPGSATDARASAALAGDLGAEWVVADGYHFADEFQKTLTGAGHRLLLIDDYGHAHSYVANIILNQNLYADARLYPRRAVGSRLLLGCDYALLRREFWPWRGWKRLVEPQARRLLITLGGADPHNVTLVLLDALAHVDAKELEVTAVVGGNNPHRQTLEGAVARSPYPVRLLQNVTNMPELMAASELAISAAGSTCWELTFLQLPALLVVLAENQRPIAAALHERGAARSLGWYAELDGRDLARILSDLLADAQTRQAMSSAATAVVDGRGADRVVAAMLAYS